jgi:hypothetical protein
MFRRGRGDASICRRISASGRRGTTRFVFNHGPDPVEFEGRVLPPAGVIW